MGVGDLLSGALGLLSQVLIRISNKVQIPSDLLLVSCAPSQNEKKAN